MVIATTVSHPEGLGPDLARDINRPTAEAAGLPNEAYTSESFLTLERERLFSPTWTCIGHACAIPAPGDARPVDVIGQPLLMVRDTGGRVRVFHNVCSHRGNQLVREPCRFARRIRCSYHSWTYDLDGTLTGTPHIGGPGRHESDRFDRSAHGLKAIRAAVWLDLVFVNLSGEAPPFEQHIAGLAERLHGLADPSQYRRMRPAATHGSFQIDFDGNWKLVVENNLESYHLPFVHQDLNARSRLEDHYHFYGGDLFAGQGSKLYRSDADAGAAAFDRFEGWPERTSEYPTLFPNVFIGVHCDHLWTLVLLPLSAGRTREHWQVYYVGETADDPAQDEAREQMLERWRSVFLEDMGVVEGMQRGRASPAFLGGVFSGVMDEPTHHFHKWVANRLVP